MMKKKVKSLLLRLAPGLFVPLFAQRARGFIQRQEASMGLVQETQYFAGRYGLRVCSGPFSGMTYPNSSLDRHLTPKLLGTYEMELHSFLEEAIAAQPSQVIDVGCAEGYYAVGLARRLPNATVWAFDPDGWARKRTKEMAEANGVDHLRILCLCSGKWLYDHLDDRTLVIMDCEGCELRLIESIPSSRDGLNGWWIIEIHEQDEEDAAGKLLERFQGTHETKLCSFKGRSRTDAPPCMDGETDSRVLQWMEEGRPQNQRWLLCKPKGL
ncbi:methyltransferase [Candidatus Methylacidiphilum infernorum]|uniref:Methyltransferase n=1 Tax=Candidatus Methylacidiphilum infernorum TaxID=511746 RepID=A0ABX7PVG3_9BACT|nr:methyltransferase [Candidatus Methylacidiphilum infernorum]QSR86641.1 methyltransferase [Candidatus Methylacidiphilum infernorum]